MTAADPAEPARLHMRVSGRVQGVGFRVFVQQSGTRFGLTGWVRNVGYSQVETVAEGRRDVLERFAGMVETGPSAARVDDAEIEWELPIGEFDRFEIR